MVARASYTSRAYAELRAALLSGDLRPGERIKIDAIRARLGIGASPVREALSLLSSEGLVDRLDQRGFRAAEVSAADFEELLATRSWLEDRALREAIRRGDAAWEEAIVLAEYRLSRAPRSTDSDRFVSNAAWEEAHRSFHTALIAACGSRYLLQFCDRLYDRNIRYRNLAGASAYPARQVGEEHRAIMEATLARDADRAAGLLLAHYETTGRYVAARIAARDAALSPPSPA